MTVSLISRLCKFKGICNIQLHIPTMLKKIIEIGYCLMLNELIAIELLI